MNSLWLSENKNDKFESLSNNIETDVCIIGAGIFGMTCGYYLSKAGLKVTIVEKEEIVSNDYDLSINKYKEVEYIPVEYPPTEEIMAEIMKLDEQATKELLELKEMLEK